MTFSIALDDLEALNPPDIEYWRNTFGKQKSLSVKQALHRGVTVPQILWVAEKIGRKDVCVRFALLCAKRVAHLNPDPRGQAAIDFAQAWLDNPCERNEEQVMRYAFYPTFGLKQARAADAASCAALSTSRRYGASRSVGAFYASNAVEYMGIGEKHNLLLQACST